MMPPWFFLLFIMFLACYSSIRRHASQSIMRTVRLARKKAWWIAASNQNRNGWKIRLLVSKHSCRKLDAGALRIHSIGYMRAKAWPSAKVMWIASSEIINMKFRCYAETWSTKDQSLFHTIWFGALTSQANTTRRENYTIFLVWLNTKVEAV